MSRSSHFHEHSRRVTSHPRLVTQDKMPMAITPPKKRGSSETDEDEVNDMSTPSSATSRSSNSNKRARFARGGRLCAKPSTRKHQPGAIVRVKLVNFVTYSAVEFHPGPSLNMVIGPNGTGKSTLVCAICIGLGWGPQHLGRAKEVSEYVKHGLQEAQIEIELAGDGKRFKGGNVVIQCNIRREGNKTTFFLNGRSSNKKAVLEVARSFSIQIDNLCQFLPQDKVVEFAAMTPVELLKSTQRAVAPQEMIDLHEQLKDLRKQQKEVQAHHVADSETLQNLEGRQRMQVADVERMREREHVKEKIRLLELCRPFAKYRGARAKNKEDGRKRNQAELEQKELNEELEPSLRAVTAKLAYQNQIEIFVKERRALVEQSDLAAQRIESRVDALLDRAKELAKEREAEIQSSKKDRQQVTRAEQIIARLKQQMEEEPPELDVSSYNERIREKQRLMEEYKRAITDLQRGQEDNTRTGREKGARIENAKKDLANLESQAGQQDRKLKEISLDTWKAWEWVKNNQKEFERPVFGPPIVECSVTDSRYVNLIETLFQKNAFLSFTVQNNADFKKLQKQTHDEMHLSEINIKVMTGNLEKFPPPVNSEELKNYGLEGWALDYLKGPEPLLAALCFDLRLHRTGVSLQDTSTQQFERLQKSPIDSWVTSKSAYNITRRREYGPDATSTRVRDTRRGTVWTTQPVDFSAKRELTENIDGWTREMGSLQSKNEEAQTEITRLRDETKARGSEIAVMQDDKANKQKLIAEFRALPTKLTQQEDRMAQSQQSLDDMKKRIAVIQEKHDAVTIERGQVALEFASAVDELRGFHGNLHEAEVMLIEASSDHAILSGRNAAVRERLEAKKAEVDQLIGEAEKSGNEARRLLNACRELMGSGDEALSAFLKTVPEGQSSDDLELEIESEKARLELMNEGNGGVIREYEQRQKRIEALTAKLREVNHGLDELNAKIKEKRDRWEPELEKLVSKISNSFSFNMKQINCAGEVGIFKDEDDFDQWAIQIRVKFRETEPLTTLDSHRQSGGERAVSTIFYLMSLQTLTRSPFRVVDEINQGMDPRNERLVHKRMVGIACGTDESAALSVGDDDNEEAGGRGGSQYFLITPKLLHGLEYARGMQVLCIASGEYMPTERDGVNFKGFVHLARGLKASGVKFGVVPRPNWKWTAGIDDVESENENMGSEEEA